MSPQKTFPEELRERAQLEWKILLRGFLLQQADEIEEAVAAFAASPTSEAKAHLEGVWARGWRYLTQSQETTA